MSRPLSTVISTTCGKIAGLTKVSKAGRNFKAFLGIPYAKPPVKSRRFASPVPIQPWTEIRQATDYGPDCVQYDYMTRSVYGEEDCLYLNVYSAAKTSDDKLPVMIWIHGGAFCIGSGSDSVYGPDRAMNQDIVLITLNYRLHCLGFMATSDGIFPGNLGLKDQLMALQWIKDNIEKFGGNSENITLFGESAGAASIHYHILSGKSDGLFHKAILQSGTAIAPWTLNRDPDSRFKNLIKALGLNPKLDSQKLKDSLMELPATDLASVACKLSPFGYFFPTIEHGHHKDTFLREDPFSIMHSGKAKDLPMIIGYNKDDGGFCALPLVSVRKSKQMRTLEGLAKAAKLGFMNASSHENVEWLKRSYFGSHEAGLSTLRALSDLMTDSYFSYPAIKTIEISVKHQKSPVYAYRYSHVGEQSLFGSMMPEDGHGPWVSHFDEVSLQFNSKIFPDPEEGSTDELISQFLWTNWSSFAKNGEPNSRWIRVTQQSDCYMDIKHQPEMMPDLFKEGKKVLWDNLCKDRLVSESERTKSKL